MDGRTSSIFTIRTMVSDSVIVSLQPLFSSLSLLAILLFHRFCSSKMNHGVEKNPFVLVLSSCTRRVTIECQRYIYLFLFARHSVALFHLLDVPTLSETNVHITCTTRMEGNLLMAKDSKE